MLLTQELPAIRSVAGDVFVFHQDNAPAHRARDTVEFLHCETPQFISPDMWPTNSRDLNSVDYCIWEAWCRSVYTKYQSAICMSCGSSFWNMGWISAERGGRCDWSVAKKDQKRISICCGVACLTFKLPIQPALFTATMVTQHNSPFSEPLTFGEKRMSSAFHKVMRWHFTGVMGKFTITVTVRFTLRYVNNQKYVRILSLKNDFFWISQGKVATTDRWGELLMQNFLRISLIKIIKIG